MENLLVRLENWLRQHRPRFLAGLRSGATAQELRELETALGRPLPAEFRALLSWRNGQGDDPIGYFENHWLFMGAREIAAAWTDLVKSRQYRIEWIPFLDDDGGDYLVLDTSATLPPVRHCVLGSTNGDMIRSSLEEWLRGFVEDLENGRYHVDPERGELLRKIDTGHAQSH